jgi:transcriptional regulator of acetoin/glycerol metabolism
MGAIATPFEAVAANTPDNQSEPLLSEQLVDNVAQRLTALVGAAVVPMETLCTAYVRAALDACGGNKSRAAKALGIDRRSIYRWLEKSKRAA